MGRRTRPKRFHLACIVFAIAMFFSVAVSIRQQGPNAQPDFQVYYAAGLMVRHHQGAHLYDRPDPRLDPVMRVTSPETPFARAAASGGVAPVLTYIYPPLLAEMMAPLSLLPEKTLAVAWRIANTAIVLACALLLGWLLGLRARGALLLFLGLFFFTPVAESIGWGQIGIFLLLCWTVGIVLYAKGYPRASALALALATAIKLTPALAVLPLLLWAEWKWLRWYAAGLAACLATMLLANGPAPLAAYFFQELPAMSAGLGNFQNKSIASALQLIALARRGQDVMTAGGLLWDNDSGPARPVVAGWVALAAKALCALVLAWAAWLIARLGRRLGLLDRTLVLAAMATLSIALSPVSWRHSYAMAAPLLVLLWHRAFYSSISAMELALLGLFSFEVGSFFLEQHAHLLLHGVALGSLAALVPALSSALVLSQLHRMRTASAPGAP